MPVDYEVDEVRGLLIWTAAGLTTEADWIACEQRVWRDPKCRTRLDVLIDVSRHESVASKAYLEGLISRVVAEPRAKGSHWAIVVSRDVSMGVALQLAAYLESTELEIRVFRERDTAEQWLATERGAG